MKIYTCILLLYYNSVMSVTRRSRCNVTGQRRGTRNNNRCFYRLPPQLQRTRRAEEEGDYDYDDEGGPTVTHPLA